MSNDRREQRIPNLKEYNRTRTLAFDILTGKEYRRKLRKEKRKRL